MPDALDISPRYLTLDSGAGHRATVMDIGATLLSCRVAMPDGSRRETLLGHPPALDNDPARGYAGAIVGRYANRIAGAAFALDGKRHALLANENGNQLHGGPDGFHRRRWTVEHAGQASVRLSLRSPDGDQGFPGEVQASVTYSLSAQGVLRIDLRAAADRPCPVSLSNHAYFNLDARHGDARGHALQINAPRYLPVDSALIPRAALEPVLHGGYNFLIPRTLRAALAAVVAGGHPPGFDHAWLLAPGCAGGVEPAAVLQSTDRKLSMAIRTSLPALQFYDGRHLHALCDRDGKPYPAFAGFALEPEFLPDSPNRPDWPQPSCILRPGNPMHHYIELAFQAHA
jgi:aldose 1-epimerase